MNPQQALDLLFQISSNSAMPMAGHMQAKQAYDVLNKLLNQNPFDASKIPDGVKAEAKKETAKIVPTPVKK